MLDHRISEANGKGIGHWMEYLQIDGLKRAGREYIGPCPICGGDDRFSINTAKGVFQCRRCDGKGDSVGLVMFVRGLKFLDALDWMCGPKQELSAEELAARTQRDAENQARKEAEAAQFRAKAVSEARAIWQEARPNNQVLAYLRARGIDLPHLPKALRFADLKYMEKIDGVYVVIHKGPAMVAAVQGRDDRLCAVHRTWFDLDQPFGKARILHPVTGALMPRKKVWGSKKGGAIRLIRGLNQTLVMGEGIETTLTAYVAGGFEGAHFWAGVDLGNMSGSRLLGQGQKFAGIPDLSDREAFVPPPWVERLVYIMDGDSDPRLTRAKLEAGLRRAKSSIPRLQIQIAACPEGQDLNDLLIGGAA